MPVTPNIQIEISGGGKCNQLRGPPPVGTDDCTLVGDDVTVTCTASDGRSSVLLLPNNGSNNVAMFDDIKAVEGNAINFICSTGNNCGNDTDMLTLVIYGEII